MGDVYSPAAGDKPQNRHSSVAFEPPSARQLKLTCFVLVQKPVRSVLGNEGDILVVAWRSTGSVYVQEEKSSVCMVCRPCAGLWSVDCGVLNHRLLMLCLRIWCVPLCLHSLTVSPCLSLHSSPLTFSSPVLQTILRFIHVSFLTIKTRDVHDQSQCNFLCIVLEWGRELISGM